jgi:hypothetical protein
MSNRKTFSSDDCDRFLENIVDQMLADWKEPEKLAITSYAASTRRLATISKAADRIVEAINCRCSVALVTYELNLGGYYGRPCERHTLPVTMPEGLRYVLVTDNWNDGVLTGHAHKFLAKSGVLHDDIAFASLIYPSIVNEYLSLATVGSETPDERTRHLTEQRIHRKPDYIGREIRNLDGLYPELLQLTSRRGRFELRYHG